jgi:hypothetical protein
VLATIVTSAVEITQADAGAIYSYNSSLGIFELAQASGIEQSLVDAVRSVRIDENDCSWVSPRESENPFPSRIC